nr:MAG TPA: hypothetical protein [Caudoviricetes sp.]
MIITSPVYPLTELTAPGSPPPPPEVNPIRANWSITVSLVTGLPAI